MGPVAGAVLAIGFEWILKGPPTVAGALAAQGDVENGDAVEDS